MTVTEHWILPLFTIIAVSVDAYVENGHKIPATWPSSPHLPVPCFIIIYHTARANLASLIHSRRGYSHTILKSTPWEYYSLLSWYNSLYSNSICPSHAGTITPTFSKYQNENSNNSQNAMETSINPTGTGSLVTPLLPRDQYRQTWMHPTSCLLI